MLPIAADAWPFLRALAVLFLVFAFLGWGALAWVCFALGAFVAFFFRDPERVPPDDPSLIVSPADGKVMRIEPADGEGFIDEPAVRVSIFLSVFNVHINRSPILGTVMYQKYRAGKMLPAFRPHASELNERNTVGIEGKGIRLLVHQITGLIARRIVCRVGPGDRLRRGQRYGLIKFGSCTEVVVPADTEILVSPGDKVRGGETPIARLPSA